MAVGRLKKVAPAKKPAPVRNFTLSLATIRKWQEENLKAAAPPCINLYGTQGPPKGHRADCHWDQIPTKQCTCRCIAAYKKGGMDAVDKLMGPNWRK